MRKPKTVKAAKRRAWEVFSKYIRRMDADSAGYVACVTCNKFDHYKNLHAGHFVSHSGGASVYIVEENVHPQCPKCNTYEGGNLIPYYQYMEKRYGVETIERLQRQKRQAVKMTLDNWHDLEIEYTEKLNAID